VLITSSDGDAASDARARDLGAVGFVPKTELATAPLYELLAGVT
jgi:isocitrate dehydrogenase